MLRTLVPKTFAPAATRAAPRQWLRHLFAGAFTLEETAKLALVLLVATLAIRLPNFGDPNYHVDESFYLLFGYQMHSGAIPYVDIWDRKPAGLFVLYWIFAGLGGVVAVQLAAIVASWVTAICIALITRIMTGTIAAAMAAIAYLATQQIFHGGGGQAPVFYNALMAAAALLTLRRLLGKADWRAAYCALLLCGLSLTIKPTTLFEGVFFGITLLLVRYQETRSLTDVLRLSVPLMLLAAAPTIAILTVFAWAGHLEAYWFATVDSIFLVTPPPLDMKIGKTITIAVFSGPLLVCAALGIFGGLLRPQYDRIAPRFVAAWLAAGALGVFALANFHPHFMLSWLVPLSVAAGLYFNRARVGPLVTACVVAYPLVLANYPQFERVRTSRETFAAATKLIQPLLRGGCLFTYEAPPMLHHATGSCLSTSRVFPEHLNNSQEARATGVDATAEVRRILSARPSVIAISRTSNVFAPNKSTRGLVLAAVNAGYHRVGQFRFYETSHWQDVDVYALNRH